MKLNIYIYILNGMLFINFSKNNLLIIQLYLLLLLYFLAKILFNKNIFNFNIEQKKYSLIIITIIIMIIIIIIINFKIKILLFIYLPQAQITFFNCLNFFY